MTVSLAAPLELPPVMLCATLAAPHRLHSVESGVATMPASIRRRRQ